ncbi:MAG: calcium/sodium antiporter [Chloroflexota bacterium]|nr:calcium/sodium antiporter [Chloroflexota bacterium]
MGDALLSLAAILVSVVVLAVVTDKFFIPSLDEISRRLKLSDEVAGASLMAIGSSAPELAIALMALFTDGGAHSDVGIGTIVGSAVFNILVITGLSAVVAGGLHIHIFAVGRDIVYYLISILYLGLVFFDGHVSLIEAILGLAGYVVYMGLLIVWKYLAPDADEAEAVEQAAEPERKKVAGWHHLESLVETVLRRITGAPDKNFVRAFAVSIALIVVLSYVLVESTIIFSAGIGIPPVIVALTLLAAGTSAPDLMASVDVAREGRGGMAVANAVGSNTFDLLVGLALPWTIALSILGLSGIDVGTGDLWVSIGILVATTLILAVFLTSKRELSRREGLVLLLLYAAFVIFTLVSGTAV